MRQLRCRSSAVDQPLEEPDRRAVGEEPELGDGEVRFLAQAVDERLIREAGRPRERSESAGQPFILSFARARARPLRRDSRRRESSGARSRSRLVERRVDVPGQLRQTPAEAVQRMHRPDRRGPVPRPRTGSAPAVSRRPSRPADEVQAAGACCTRCRKKKRLARDLVWLREPRVPGSSSIERLSSSSKGVPRWRRGKLLLETEQEDDLGAPCARARRSVTATPPGSSPRAPGASLAPARRRAPRGRARPRACHSSSSATRSVTAR